MIKICTFKKVQILAGLRCAFSASIVFSIVNNLLIQTYNLHRLVGIPKKERRTENGKIDTVVNSLLSPFFLSMSAFSVFRDAAQTC